MKVMSIDGSSKSTGVAILEEKNVLYYENIIANEVDPLVRIKKMAKRIGEIYDEYKPDKIVMEDILPQDVRNNQQVFKILHYLQAAIVLELHGKNAPQVELYVASHWRKLIGVKTGRGVKRESLKQAVKDYIKIQYGIEANDDVCDGIAIGAAWFNENSGHDWSD